MYAWRVRYELLCCGGDARILRLSSLGYRREEAIRFGWEGPGAVPFYHVDSLSRSFIKGDLYHGENIPIQTKDI